MKILFPVQVFYPSQAGGPANSVYWLTKHLKRQGIDPVIVASDLGLGSNEPRNKWIENEAGSVIHVKTFTSLVPLVQAITSLGSIRKADVVHLSSVFYPVAFVTAFAAWLLGKKIVWSTRGELDPPVLTDSPRRKRPVRWAIKQFLANEVVFHSTCDQETSYIKNAFGEKAKVVQIPNFIDPPVAVARTADKYLLYLGRIHPKKAIDNLIKAISLNNDFQDRGYKLKIAGRGPSQYESKLKNLTSELNLNDKVEFVGQVEGDEKQTLFANAFCTILPSHTENFGMVVLESLAQNTPVIASKGTPWKILEREKAGVWTDNSPECLSQAISRIIQMDADEYEEFRSRGRDFVESEFSIEKNIGKWVTFYNELK